MRQSYAAYRIKISYHLGYGSINRQPNAGSIDFSYGYSNCNDADSCNNKTKGYIAVDWNKYPGEINGSTDVAIEEFLEMITYTSNICGDLASWLTSKNGKWTEIGEDLITYIFVKE